MTSAEDSGSKVASELLDQLRGLEAKGSPGLAAQVLEVFLLDTSSRLTALREALDRRDGKAAYQAAHSMQGSAGMVGVQSMAERCRQLADAARDESFDRCEALAAELMRGFEAMQRAAASQRRRS